MPIGFKFCLAVFPIQPSFNPAIPKRPGKVKSQNKTKTLWSEDLKASLRIAAEKLIHKTSVVLYEQKDTTNVI